MWFDENAVPRYCDFDPRRSASIYVSEVALAEVRCQGCGTLFRVAFSAVNVREKTVAENILDRTLHYGDPPNTRCCDAGPCMNSEPRRVLQYWSRAHKEYTRLMAGSDLRKVTDSHRYHLWERNPALEIGIEPDWVAEP